MFLIVGLGNPGKKYEGTRHNAGFIFLDRFFELLYKSSRLMIDDWKKEDSFQSDLSFIRDDGHTDVILQKPFTFMNKSGEAVSKLMKKFKIPIGGNNIVLVHDDLDIELGKYKIQRARSPRDHKGVLSVEKSLGSSDFLRVRIGVDSRAGDRTIRGEDYVLMKLSKEEKEILDESIEAAVKDLREVIQY